MGELAEVRGTPLLPLSSHALIEFGSRAASGVVGFITVVAALLAFTRRPFRRDLAILALLLPLGVVAQAVLGGLTVPQPLVAGLRDGALRAVAVDPGGGVCAGVAEHV